MVLGGVKFFVGVHEDPVCYAPIARQGLDGEVVFPAEVGVEREGAAPCNTIQLPGCFFLLVGGVEELESWRGGERELEGRSAGDH